MENDWVKDKEKYKQMERWEKLENSEFKNQTSLYKYLKTMYNEEDTIIKYIHYNLGTVKVNVEIPNSLELLIDKLFELTDDFKKDDIENDKSSIVTKLVMLNENAYQELKEIDKEVLGISKKSPRSVIFELLQINAHIEKYKEMCRSINDVSLEQLLMDSLEESIDGSKTLKKENKNE